MNVPGSTTRRIRRFQTDRSSGVRVNRTVRRSPGLSVTRWNRFSYPDPLPEFSSGFPTIWWYDEAKAAATGGAR